MAYAADAGLDTTKICLEGTRTDLLTEIIDWIHSPEPDCPRVFWLHGEAGKGKSTIAHTIAKWLKELGGPGSCFCFARDRSAERRHEKLFTTIAHGLADCDPTLKRALAGVLASDHSLKTTADVMQQWRKLILQPLSNLSSPIIGPVVIIIDALDESGTEASRRNILRILASTETTNLPANFRILLTSRPLPDIYHALHDAKHVKAESIDDTVAASTYRDLCLYISDELRGDFCEEQVATTLARKSDGLFEWARLACEFIRSQKTCSTPQQRYNDLVSRGRGEGEALLDDMYRAILRDVVEPTPEALARFRSVMHQVLCTMEPLPMDSLTTMRRNFRRDLDRYDVEVVLRSMAPLLSGITDPSRPIRPLHSTFFEFLTDASQSEEFFVDIFILDTHVELAYSALCILQQDLRFNICGLESSYTRNSDIADLASRIKNHVSPHLSYSCRHWVSHLRESAFDSQVAKEVERFFKGEQTLFWVEALSLLKELGNAHVELDGVIRWAGVSKAYLPYFHIGLSWLEGT